jgi:hypothetical protein
MRATPTSSTSASLPTCSGGARSAPSYVVEHARFVAEDVAVAYVRRQATTPRTSVPEPGKPGSFDELALFVLVRREGAWWLAAGQHVPDRRDVYKTSKVLEPSSD